MASTSGRIEGPTYNGSRFYLQWQLAGQNVAGNYSTINWQWGLTINPGGYYWLSNAVKSVSGYINGAQIFGANTWSNISGTGDHQLLSGSMNIGHNGDGTKVFDASNTGWLYSYGNVSGGSGAWELPQIPRYANITYFEFSNVDDVGFTVNVSADATCNLLQYSLNGGAFTTAYSGNFTSRSFDLGGAFSSEQTYTVKIRVRRADSGLTTDSGTKSVVTTPQARAVGLWGM